MVHCILMPDWLECLFHQTWPSTEIGLWKMGLFFNIRNVLSYDLFMGFDFLFYIFIHVSLCAAPGICSDFSFKCKNEACVNKVNAECDRVKDCTDESDEEGCGKTRQPSSKLFHSSSSFTSSLVSYSLGVSLCLCKNIHELACTSRTPVWCKNLD